MKLYLVPRHITDQQLRKIFDDNLKSIQDHNSRDRLVVLNKPATHAQDALMNLIYN